MLLSGVVRPWCLKVFATVFLAGFAGSPSEGSRFVVVPCCAPEILWRGAGELNVSLDAIFEPLAWVSQLSMAFRELTTERLSRDSGLDNTNDTPVCWSWAFTIITWMLVV